MPFFTPPTDNFVVFGSTYDNLADDFFSRLPPVPRGRNIYKLSNGSFTDNQPPSLSDAVATYYGGHSTEITQAEANDLTEAGYGDYIT